MLQSDPKNKSTDLWKMMDKWDEEHPVPIYSVEKVANHIDHIVETAGLDHVGLCSDFEGIPVVPDQLSDVSYFPCITQILLNRGYEEDAIRKILGGNFIRVLKKAEEMV